MDLSQYEYAWETEVRSKSLEIDPNCRHDWLSLATGWGLGKGLDTDTAYELAIHLERKGLL